MPVSENTKRILADLQRLGIDKTLIQNLTTQLDANPAADKQINDGIIRLPEFTRIMQQKSDLEASISKKAQALAAGHDLLKSGQLADDQKSQLQTYLDGIEKFLIDEGYPEDEVKALSNDAKLILSAPVETPPNSNPNPQTPVINPDPNKKEEIEMKPEDIQNQINSGMAQAALGGFGLNMKVQAALVKFNRLYGRDPSDEEFNNFETKLTNEVMKGNPKALETAGEEIFKFSEKQTELANKDLEAKIQAARDEGAREALKNAGVITPKRLIGQGNSPAFRSSRILTNQNKSQTSAQQNQQNPQTPPVNPPPAINPNNPVVPNPNDKHAELRDENGRLPYERRGDRTSRVIGALQFADSHSLDLSDTSGFGALEREYLQSQSQ